MLQSNVVTNKILPINNTKTNAKENSKKTSSDSFSSLLDDISDDSAKEQPTTEKKDRINLAANMLLFLLSNNSNLNNAFESDSDSNNGSIDTKNTNDSNVMMNLLNALKNNADTKGNNNNIVELLSGFAGGMDSGSLNGSISDDQILSFINELVNASMQGEKNVPETSIQQSNSLNNLVNTLGQNDTITSVGTSNMENIGNMKESSLKDSLSTRDINISNPDAKATNLSSIHVDGNTARQNTLNIINQSSSSENMTSANTGAASNIANKADINELVNTIKAVLNGKENSNSLDRGKLMMNLQTVLNAMGQSEKTIENQSTVIKNSNNKNNDVSLNNILQNNTQASDSPIKAVNNQSFAFQNGLGGQDSSNNSSSDSNVLNQSSADAIQNSTTGTDKNAVSQFDAKMGSSQIDVSHYAVKNTVDMPGEVGNVIKNNIVKYSYLTSESGKKDMEVQLHPDDLGKITIRLQSVKGEMNIRIFATNSEVKDAITNQTMHIVEAMKEQGIKVNNLDVIYSNLSNNLANQNGNGSLYQNGGQHNSSSQGNQSQGQAKMEYEQHVLDEGEISNVPLLYNSSVEYIV